MAGTPSTNIVVKGNVVVPPGATCWLISVTLYGNIEVQPGGTLLFSIYGIPGPASNHIFGNLTANQAVTVSVGYTVIEGNVVIVNSGSADFFRSELRKNATFIANNELWMFENNVAKNLSCTANGSVTLFDVYAGGISSGQCSL